MKGEGSMKKAKLTLLSAVIAAGLVALMGCPQPTSGGGGGGTTVTAPTKLFNDTNLTWYISGNDANGAKVMIADLDTNSTIDVSTIPGSVTFGKYPAWWDGAIAFAQSPTGADGLFDLTNVKAIRFKIKSSTITPDQLAFFIQWKSDTAGFGGEYTIPLKDKGILSLTDWQQVEINLAPNGDIPDTITTKRYGFEIENFHTGTGKTNVDVALAIKWYGSDGTDPNAGPLKGGETYQIGDIEFVGYSDEQVQFYSNIIWNAPNSLPSAPTIDAANVISLLNSSGTYTDITVQNWNPNWGQAGSITNATIAGKTIKLLDLQNYQGVAIDETNGIDITGKTKLHMSIWTTNGQQFSVYAISSGTEQQLLTGTINKGVWNDIVIDVSTEDLTKVIQLKFTAATTLGGAMDVAVGKYYLDNIYFATE